MAKAKFKVSQRASGEWPEPWKCVGCLKPASKDNPLWPELGRDNLRYLVHRNCRHRNWWNVMLERKNGQR